MTEEEAKTKWCPFARATIYTRGNLPGSEDPMHMIGHGSNRVCVDPDLQSAVREAIDRSGATRCIGSACMAFEVKSYKNNAQCLLMRPRT